MKKYIFTLLLAVLLPLVLVSCNTAPVESPIDTGTDSALGEGNASGDSNVSIDPVCTVGQMDRLIYGDTFYFLRNLLMDIYYYDLTDIEAGTFPVNPDPLIEDEVMESGKGINANPACVSGNFFAVSPELTAKNGGIPVILLFQKNYNDNGEETAHLYKYNTATSKTTLLCNETSTMLQSMHLYGDTVVFTVNEEKKGWNIYRVSVDGEDFVKKDNPKRANYRVVTVYGERIYYVDEKTDTLYSCSLMLDDEKELLHTSIIQINPFIVDGYLYYAGTKASYVEYEGGKSPGYDLYRAPLDDLEVSELFLENLSSAIYYNDRLVYRYNEPYRINEERVAASACHYAYSFETEETTRLYDFAGTAKIRN